MPSQECDYDAFISYRTSKDPDMQVAESLQHMLETFPIPSRLKAVIVKPGRLRNRLKVFRDSTDICANPDLTSVIREKLERSRFLIVVCTPQLPESQHCLEEIRYFRSLNGDDRILTLLAKGDPQTSFPPALISVHSAQQASTETASHSPTQPLAVDIRAESLRASLRKLSGKGLNKSRQPRFQLLAPLLGCKSPDELVQRDKERFWRKVKLYGGVMAGCLLLLFGYLYDQYRREQVREGIKQLAQATQWSDAAKLQIESDPIQAALVAAEALKFSLENQLGSIHVEQAMRDVLVRCPIRTYIPNAAWTPPKLGADLHYSSLTELPGRRFAGIGSDGVIRIWDLCTEEPVELEANATGAFTLLALPDGRFTSVSRDKATIWDFTSDNAFAVKTIPFSTPIDARPLIFETWLVTAGNGTIELWDLRSPGNDEPLTLPGVPKDAGNMRLMQNKRLAVQTNEPALYVWDLSKTPFGEPAVYRDAIDHWIGLADGRIAIVIKKQDNDSGEFSIVSLWSPTEPESSANPYILERKLGVVNTIAEVGTTDKALDIDERQLAIGTRDSKVIRWDLQKLSRRTDSGAPDLSARNELVVPHEEGVTSFCEGVRGLVSGGADGTVRTENGVVIRHEKVGKDQKDQAVKAIRLVGNSYIVSEGPDGIRLCARNSKNQSESVYLTVLPPPKDPNQYVIKPSPNDIGAFLSDAPISRNGLRIGDLGEIAPTALKPTSWLVMGSGEVVVAFPYGIVAVWNPSGGDAAIVHSTTDLGGESSLLNLASCTAVDESKVVTSVGGNAMLWSLNESDNSAKCLRRFNASEELKPKGDKLVSVFPHHILVHSGRWLVISNIDGQMLVWDLTDPPGTQPIELEAFKCPPVALVEGRLANFTSTDVRIWNLLSENPSQAPAILPVKRTVSELSQLAVMDRGRLACANDDEITVWCPETDNSDRYEVECAFSTSDFARSDLEFLVGTPVFAILPLDGDRLASGCGDGTILVWNLKKPRERPVVLTGHYGMILSLESLSGNRMASTSQDGKILIWDLKQVGAAPLRLVAPVDKTSRLLALANNHLACRCTDGSVRIWDLNSDQPQLSQLMLQGGEMIDEGSAHLFGRNALITLGSEKLACGDSSGTIRIFDLDPHHLLQRTRRAVGRNLSRIEWEQFFPDRPYRLIFPELAE